MSKSDIWKLAEKAAAEVATWPAAKVRAADMALPSGPQETVALTGGVDVDAAVLAHRLRTGTAQEAAELCGTLLEALRVLMVWSDREVAEEMRWVLAEAGVGVD